MKTHEPQLIGTVKFKHWSCDVFKSTYQSDPTVPALLLIGSEGSEAQFEQIATASVNLSASGNEPARGCVFIKNWGGLETMPQILQDAGIIGPELRQHPAGFCEATEHRLLK